MITNFSSPYPRRNRTPANIHAEGIWRPQNASNRFYGPSPLRTGIEMSRNLMTVRLANDMGMNLVAEYAERFGIYNKMNPVLAMLPSTSSRAPILIWRLAG